MGCLDRPERIEGLGLAFLSPCSHLSLCSCFSTLGLDAGCFPCWFAAALVMEMVRACNPDRSPKGRKTRSMGFVTPGCGVLTASAQSGPTLDASKGAALELSLANWDYECSLFPAKNTPCGLGSRDRVVKSGERRESTLELFLLHFPPLEGWISDKNADLLSLGADEAIAASARWTLRRRVGVAGEVEPPERVCLSVRGERPRADLPLACTACRAVSLLQHPALWLALNSSLSRETPLQSCILFMVGPECWGHGSSTLGCGCP